MELRAHWQIIKSHLWIIVAGAILGMLAGFFVAYLPAEKQEASLAFFITSKNQNVEAPHDAYDESKSAELLGDTLMSLTITPEIVEDIYQRAGIATPQNSTVLIKMFRARRYAPQNIVIKFSGTNETTLRKLGDSLKTTLTGKMSGLPEAKSFNVSAGELTIVPIERKISAAILIGLFFGLGTGVFIAHFLNYRSLWQM
ncbi:MAG: hypothetical protein PHD51_03390 [Patescibacteria group bacterium]|nr:hypothetical protein [Patescibacteria group bacterium]MDD5490979.1 hypothetical protein [Patescibacteria group bacterium]